MLDEKALLHAAWEFSYTKRMMHRATYPAVIARAVANDALGLLRSLSK